MVSSRFFSSIRLQVSTATVLWLLAAPLAAQTRAVPRGQQPATSGKTSGSSSAESAELAKQLWQWYGDASDLHDAGKLDEAWEVYQKIWKHRQSYDVATSLGSICMRRGEYAHAAHYFDIALQKMVPTQTPEFVSQVTREFESAKEQVVKVVVVPTERLTSDVTLTDLVRREPLIVPVYVAPGAIELRAAFAEQSDVTFRTTAKAGEQVTWDITRDDGEGPAPDDAATAGELDGAATDSARTVKTRHPAIVFPIGGVLTAGLAAGAWLQFREGQQAYEDVVSLNLRGTSCVGVTEGVCAQAAEARERSRSAERVGYWLTGGAALAAVATVATWWLWETEVPVAVTANGQGGFVTWSVTY
jgi:tetratricopeptide (TPR) repeat protein